MGRKNPQASSNRPFAAFEVDSLCSKNHLAIVIIDEAEIMQGTFVTRAPHADAHWLICTLAELGKRKVLGLFGHPSHGLCLVYPPPQWDRGYD